MEFKLSPPLPSDGSVDGGSRSQGGERAASRKEHVCHNVRTDFERKGQSFLRLYEPFTWCGGRITSCGLLWAVKGVLCLWPHGRQRHDSRRPDRGRSTSRLTRPGSRGRVSVLFCSQLNSDRSRHPPRANREDRAPAARHTIMKPVEDNGTMPAYGGTRRLYRLHTRSGAA